MDPQNPPDLGAASTDQHQSVLSAPRIEVFDERNLDDKAQTQSFGSSMKDLKLVKGRGFLGTGNWDKEIKSFRVYAGRWRFCQSADWYEPWPVELKPGDYGNVVDFGIPEGDGHRGISSIELIGM